MKHISFVAVCLAFLLVIPGCAPNRLDSALTPGNYYAVGDYEENLTPYLFLNTDDQSFILGAGSIISYAEIGSFKIKDGKLIAKSQTTTFVFKVKNPKTLILIDNGDNDYFKLPENTEFVLSDDKR